MNEVKGYKVFNCDWTCSKIGEPIHTQVPYEVGKTYSIKEKPSQYNGYQFYKELQHCINPYHTNYKIAEIVALGDISSDTIFHFTNRIKIVRELDWKDVFDMYNDGRDNIGKYNSGDNNIGDGNMGNNNRGSDNIGDNNQGDDNSGNYNIGWKNIGSRNAGGWNTGSNNIGWHNTGDWNITNHCSGYFNTKEPTLMLFNKPSDWTYDDWENSDANYVLLGMPPTCVHWTYESIMTDREKIDNPNCKTVGGMLTVAYSTATQMWWDNLIQEDKNAILKIPNFDADIFYETTGIRV